MSTITTTNPVPTDPASLTTSPDAVHEAHTLMTLNTEVLRCDADVQPRLALSEAHIRAYAALLQEGHQLGTIVVFQNGLDYYLADGFHRVAAAKSIGLAELPAETRVGTKRDAVLYACGTNKHGKPLSHGDKQRVVRHVLEDAEWGQWSDREIARHCGVSHVFVAKLRKALTGNVTSERTYRTKQGTVTTMETCAIGKRTASPPETPAAEAEAPVLLDAADNDKAVLPDVDTQVTPVVQVQTKDKVPPSAPQDCAGRVPTPETIVRSVQTVVDPAPATPHPLPSDPAPGPGFDPSAFLTLLRTMKSFPDPTNLVGTIPPTFAYGIDPYRMGALGWLNTFTKEWKSHTLIQALPDEEHDKV